MLRDITLGQYYPAESPIHKLDPRAKLFGTLIFIISLFVCQGIPAIILTIVFLAWVIGISKVPFSFMARGLKAIVILMAIMGVFNLFLTPGVPLWHFGILTITEEGLKNALLMLYRLVLLIIGTSIMTLTTTPNELTDGMEKSMHSLNRIHVPVHEISMMMSIALRFIPILIEETDKIMKAQMARGADFESGNIMKKAKAMVPLLVPLFVSAFRRANDLAMAMEARCYRGGEGRTKMKPLRYQKRDYIAYVITIAYLAAVIVLRIVWAKYTAA
jgi:energy-coupling factor transport system permease protein